MLLSSNIHFVYLIYVRLAFSGCCKSFVMETEAEVAASPRVHLKLTNEEALAIIKRMVRLSNLFLNGEKSKEHEWFEELCEALKKSYTTPANLTFAYKDGFRGGHSAVVNSLHQILTLLRDSLLHMRLVAFSF